MRIRYGAQSIDIGDAVTDPDLMPTIAATCMTYLASMRMEGPEPAPMPKMLRDLLPLYWRAMGFNRKLVGKPIQAKPFKSWRGKKTLVALSGGKDSVRVLIEAVCRPGKVQAYYVEGVNKSETYYERRAVESICDRLDVPLTMIKVKVRGQMNRKAHAIGLRDQLLIGLGLPLAKRIGANRIALGVHFQPSDVNTALFSESQLAIERYEAWIQAQGFDGTVTTSPWDEIEMLRYMLVEEMDIMEMTSSCYTQRNFREHHNERMRARFPDSWVYPTGCGVCVKCLRINGTKAAMDGDRQMLEYVLNRASKDHANDPTLTAIAQRL